MIKLYKIQFWFAFFRGYVEAVKLLITIGWGRLIYVGHLVLLPGLPEQYVDCVTSLNLGFYMILKKWPLLIKIPFIWCPNYRVIFDIGMIVVLDQCTKKLSLYSANVKVCGVHFSYSPSVQLAHIAQEIATLHIGVFSWILSDYFQWLIWNL